MKIEGSFTMKISKKIIIAFILLGIIGFILQFTPLNNIQVNSGRRRTAPLPLVIMAAGFGTAGALISVLLKDKRKK